MLILAIILGVIDVALWFMLQKSEKDIKRLRDENEQLNRILYSGEYDFLFECSNLHRSRGTRNNF
ncbi:MAG: hypothetical protein RSD35_07945 [Oscillospiraceae bacterium]